MNAVLWIAVEPRTDADRQNLARGLTALSAEDPTIGVRTDPVTGETIISGTWDWHLEVILDRLKREFNVEASVGRPRIAYKEAFTRAADGETKYVSRVGAPRKPPPPLRTFGIALPEPDADDTVV